MVGGGGHGELCKFDGFRLTGGKEEGCDLKLKSGGYSVTHNSVGKKVFLS